MGDPERGRSGGAGGATLTQLCSVRDTATQFLVHTRVVSDHEGHTPTTRDLVPPTVFFGP